MIFRNIIFSALFVGLIAGIIYGLFQQTLITPIIIDAEQYEVVEEVVETATAETTEPDHHHGPRGETSRIFQTLFTTVLAGTAFAIFLISLMMLHNVKSSKPKLNAVRGLGWGIAAMLAVFVAPAMIGLHPEIPGTIAAELDARQQWWIFCALATALGIAILYYLKPALKAIGLIFIALPHVIGAPHPDGLSFANTDPAAVAALTELSGQFYTMTAIGMLLFCLLLGALSGYATNRFIKME